MKQRIMILLLLTLLCGYLSALGVVEFKEEPGKPRDVKIAALKGPTGVSMLGLIDKNPALGENINVTYEIVNSPDLMTAKVLSGEVAIASFPANLAAKIYNRGAPVVLGATTGYAAFSILSSREDVSSLKDLRGKTVYNIGKGGNTEILLNYLLLRAGIEPGRDVTVDYRYSHLEIAPLLITGKIDLALLPEPFATMVLAKNNKVRIAADLQSEWKKIQGENSAIPVSVVIINKNLAAERPDFIRNFLREYESAIQWINGHPREGGVLAEKYMELPADTIASALSRLHLVFVDAQKGKKEMDEYLSLLLSVDPESVGGKIPDEAFYY